MGAIHAGIAGCDENVLHLRVLREPPRVRMFAAASADNEEFGGDLRC